MTNSETAWQVDVDYKALALAGNAKSRMAQGRGARSAVKAAGYLHGFVCATRTYAEAMADEIRTATGVPMRVSEVAVGIWR